MAELITGYQLYSHEVKLQTVQTSDEIIDVVDTMLYDAIEQGVSDIHLQPHEYVLLVRFRRDGHLYDAHTLPQAQMPLVISRIKVLAQMDIAQRRLPQDGRFRVAFYGNDGGERTIDVRVASFPSVHGEKLVLRILDQAMRLLGLNDLGLAPTMRETLMTTIKAPHGLFLVTGPTGCGKTTMLYALLTLLNERSKNMVTIEDPVEYQLAGITQSQINVRAGFTFASGLRALLRQDPDIIMIGEIRDKETAQIAIEAALTGHLVLSTLHTNDAPSAPLRLVEMGVPPYLLAATLTGVLAQRLVRRLCKVCSKQASVNPGEQEFLRAHKIALEQAPQAVGCNQCAGIGYSGQMGVFELLVMDSVRGVQVAAGGHDFAAFLRGQGMPALVHDGMQKVRDGVTSIAEVMRLVG